METSILQKIESAALRFLQPLSLEETYKSVIEEAIKLVEGDQGYLAMADSSGELEIVYAIPRHLSKLKMRKRGYSYTAYNKKKAFVVYAEEYRNIHPELIAEGIQSTLFIPLSDKGKSVGVMNIMSKHGSKRFTQKELSILKVFGSMASLAIRNSQMFKQIQSALETRDKFISMAAHELRTPLTSISGYVQLLHAKLSGSETSESRWVDLLYWEVKRMVNLINELLEINRIKSGEFQYAWKECDLKEILERVVNNFKFIYPDRSIIIEEKTSSSANQIIGDYDKIIQVITNIIDNAFKFSNTEKPVMVKLTSDSQRIKIEIKDFGKGIAKKDLPFIFDNFYRGQNLTEEGMGMGLYLVKDIISRHHGTIKVHSALNKGTKMTVELPKIKNHRALL